MRPEVWAAATSRWIDVRAPVRTPGSSPDNPLTRPMLTRTHPSPAGGSRTPAQHGCQPRIAQEGHLANRPGREPRPLRRRPPPRSAESSMLPCQVDGASADHVHPRSTRVLSIQRYSSPRSKSDGSTGTVRTLDRPSSRTGRRPRAHMTANVAIFLASDKARP